MIHLPENYITTRSHHIIQGIYQELNPKKKDFQLKEVQISNLIVHSVVYISTVMILLKNVWWGLRASEILETFGVLMELFTWLTEKHEIKDDCLRMIISGVKHSEDSLPQATKKIRFLLLSLLKPAVSATLKTCGVNIRMIYLMTFFITYSCDIMILLLNSVKKLILLHRLIL